MQYGLHVPEQKTACSLRTWLSAGYPVRPTKNLHTCDFGLKYYQLYSGQINSAQFIANSVAIFITGVIIAFTSMRRSELFFSGLVESTMILLYLSTLVLQY